MVPIITDFSPKISEILVISVEAKTLYYVQTLWGEMNLNFIGRDEFKPNVEYS
jgi:hypothetical protein